MLKEAQEASDPAADNQKALRRLIVKRPGEPRTSSRRPEQVGQSLSAGRAEFTGLDHAGPLLASTAPRTTAAV